MSEIKIGNFLIGKKSPCFIIAEAGVNHNGDLKMAIELVRHAKLCGADCVKFQTFKIFVQILKFQTIWGPKNNIMEADFDKNCCWVHTIFSYLFYHKTIGEFSQFL